MVKVPITEQMIAMARQMENRVLSNLPNRPNYTGLEVKGRYFTGFMGELGFLKLLFQNNKEGIWSEGQWVDWDFTVYPRWGKSYLDVKTGALEHYKYILVLVAEVKFNDAIYVGTKLTQSGVEIYGYCFLEEFEQNFGGINPGIPGINTFYKELTMLSPIEGLLGSLEDGQISPTFFDFASI